MFLSDGLKRLIFEYLLFLLCLGKGGVSLYQDLVLLAGVNGLLIHVHRVSLDLVHNWLDVGDRENVLDMVRVKVRDTNRLD